MEINYETIERYILGELTEDELTSFEQKMETDAVFKQEVLLYKTVNKSLQNKYSSQNKKEALTATLQKMNTKHFESAKNLSQKPNGSFLSKILKISSIAAILVIGFFLLKPQVNLYSTYAEHQNLELQVKGNNESTLLETAELFNDKNYEAAAPLLKNYLAENPEDEEIQIAYGISLLETEKIAEAQQIFTSIYDKNTVFKNKAAWYLALSFLKQKNELQTIAFLNKIDSESFYGKKAEKLKNELVKNN